MKLSIIVPVYNEKTTILIILNKLIKLKLPAVTEIIIVDDGSTDGTGSLINSFIKKKKLNRLKVIVHKQNSGKGEAIKSAVKKASGDFILIQDADLEYNPDEIVNLLKPLKNRRLKNLKNIAVFGSRFKNNYAVIPKVYYLGNKMLTFITNIVYGVKLNDMETGYKLLPRSFARKVNLRSSHFNIEPEITAKLIKMGIIIKEVPISYKGRSHLAGKKLTFMDAFEAIKAIFYFRFFN